MNLNSHSSLKKITYFILFSLISQMSIAQCDEARVFTEEQKESFVKVYLKLKLVKPGMEDAKRFEIATKYKIAPGQFQAFQDSSNINRQLSSHEQAFFNELHILNRNIQTNLENKQVELCKIENIALVDYLAIHHQYRSCMKFQRLLSPYFDNLMK